MKIFNIRNISILLTTLIAIMFMIVFLKYINEISSLISYKKVLTPYSADSRIHFEGSDSVFARDVSNILDSLILYIKTEHSLIFIKSFKIIVCGSQKSLNRLLGEKTLYPVRGAILLGNIYLSPRVYDYLGQNNLKFTLLHELTHLIVKQHLGFFKEQKIPVWFREGFADYISEGAEDLNPIWEQTDLQLFLRRFVPHKKSNFTISFRRQLNGIPATIYHKGVSDFIRYILEKYPQEFENFKILILDCEEFNHSFETVFLIKINDLWEEFKKTKIQESKSELYHSSLAI